MWLINQRFYVNRINKYTIQEKHLFLHPKYILTMCTIHLYKKDKISKELQYLYMKLLNIVNNYYNINYHTRRVTCALLF